MSQISKIESHPSQLTRWSAPLLDAKLSGLLDSYTSLRDAPTVGPKTAAALAEFVENSEYAPMPHKDDVETMLGLLAAVKRRRQNSEAEASAQLELYWQGLKDIPLDDLRFAYDALLKSSPWFPDISEIRAAADGGPVKRHRIRASIAQALIGKHEREWVPPAEVCTPEQAKEIRAMIEGVGKP